MKRAIVVGASSGIGKATALKLANSGWDVIVHGFRKSAETHALAEQIQSLGRKSHALIADLSQTAQVQNLVEQAWSVWDGLDAWLHLAGADILTGDARHANFHHHRLPRCGSEDDLPRPRLDCHHGLGSG